MILGLGGWATCGKDAAADILVRDHQWAKTYMSEPLERALLVLDPIVGWDVRFERHVTYRTLHSQVGYTRSKENPEVRRLLQVLGTEVVRDMIDPWAWTRLAFQRVRELQKTGTTRHVVITGIRFENELEVLRSHGGVAVWIHRPGVDPVNTHASDNSLKAEDFDAVLTNGGDLDDLAQAIGHYCGDCE